jgi:DNA ligase-1
MSPYQLTQIGAVRLTLLTALARAASLLAIPDEELDVLPVPEKGKKPADPAREAAEDKCAEAVRLVRRVYVRHPNYGDLVRGLEGGLDGLEARVPLSVGIPISPMLGSITRSIDEVYARLGSLPFTAETKLDGQRLQMHVRRDGPQGEDDGGGRWVEGENGRAWVRLFSRHLEDMTDKYPDICARGLDLLSAITGERKPFPSWATAPAPEVAALLDTKRITSLIVDAEIVAIDKDSGAHRTFQDLTNRARKDVRVEDIKVVVEVNAFDLMLVNDVVSYSLVVGS